MYKKKTIFWFFKIQKENQKEAFEIAQKKKGPPKKENQPKECQKFTHILAPITSLNGSVRKALLVISYTTTATDESRM